MEYDYGRGKEAPSMEEIHCLCRATGIRRCTTVSPVITGRIGHKYKASLGNRIARSQPSLFRLLSAWGTLWVLHRGIEYRNSQLSVLQHFISVCSILLSLRKQNSHWLSTKDWRFYFCECNKKVTKEYTLYFTLQVSGSFTGNFLSLVIFFQTLRERFSELDFQFCRHRKNCTNISGPIINYRYKYCQLDV